MSRCAEDGPPVGRMRRPWAVGKGGRGEGNDGVFFRSTLRGNAVCKNESRKARG